MALEIELKIKRNISDEMLSDLFATALETDAISYWCPQADPVCKDRQYVSAVLYEDKDETGQDMEKHEIDGPKIIAAIQRIASENLCRDDIRQSIISAIIEEDAGQIDAEGIDTIFQVAVLGDLVYG